VNAPRPKLREEQNGRGGGENEQPARRDLAAPNRGAGRDNSDERCVRARVLARLVSVSACSAVRAAMSRLG
jgi:hypothetical protein